MNPNRSILKILFRKSTPGCLALSFFLLLFTACGPNQGIEVGNPKLGGKSVTLQGPDPNESFVIQFLSDTTSQVSKVVDGQFETVAASTTIVNYQVSVTADFSGGPHFEADLEVDEEGNVKSAQLKLDGNDVPVEATVKNHSKATIDPSNYSDDALTLVTALCDRIVECDPSVVVSDCETEVYQTPGLAQELGSPPGQSLQEASESDPGFADANDDLLAECLSDVELLPCKQAEKWQTNIRHLIPKPSCPHAFSKNP